MPTGSLPLVSIITPIFNSEKFLAETVESVIGQEYENWELILINDGSSDNSQAIALRFEEKYPGKIIYLEHEGGVNKGVAATRNLGISKAKGKYISLLDSDDLWKPVMLKEQVEFLEKNPGVDVLSEATLYWNSWGDPAVEDEIILLGVPAERKYSPPQLAWKMYPLGPGRAPCMCGIMIKANKLREIGGFESSFVGKDQLYEDQAFAIKLYLHTIVYVSSKCNNIYRQRPDSLMHGLIDAGLYKRGRHFFLIWLKGYLREKQVKDFRIGLKLFKAFLPYKYPRSYKFLATRFWKLKQSLILKKSLVNE